jgi:two-component system LytT family response regulator
MRGLIVEDEAMIAHALRQCLQAAGFEVIGLAATEPVGRHLSARERPDAAVVDVKLRSGSGLDLARSLIEQGTAVLFVTGNGRDVVADSGLRAAYLEKPFDVRNIALAVRAAQHMRDTGALPEWAPNGVRQVRS